MRLLRRFMTESGHVLWVHRICTGMFTGQRAYNAPSFHIDPEKPRISGPDAGHSSYSLEPLLAGFTGTRQVFHIYKLNCGLRATFRRRGRTRNCRVADCSCYLNLVPEILLQLSAVAF